MDLLSDLDEEALLDPCELCSQLVDYIAKITDELSSLFTVELAEASRSILHDLWLTRLSWSSVPLDYLLVLHPQLEDFPILFLKQLFFLAQILFHLVKGVLSGRDDVLHALLGRWGAVLPVITTMVD